MVLLSVVLHGGGIAFYLRRLARAAGQAGDTPVPPAAAPSSAGPAVSSTPAPRPSEPEAEAPERINLDEVKRLRAEGVPLLVVDVRTERSYREDTRRAAGALRLPPDDAVRLARERRLDPHSTLVLYCT